MKKSKFWKSVPTQTHLLSLTWLLFNIFPDNFFLTLLTEIPVQQLLFSFLKSYLITFLMYTVLLP